MSKVVIILSETGVFETAYADFEIEVKVLKRGQDESDIAFVEETLDEIL